MYMDRIQKDIWDEWGWEDATFIGYIDGKPVATRKFVKNPLPAALKAVADDASMRAERGEEPYDVTRVVFEAQDQYGNNLDYMMDSIEFTVTGPAKLIGPASTTMQGGCIACWVRTVGQTGTVRVSAKTPKLVSNEVVIEVK